MKTKWTDGWHDVEGSTLRYYIEDGMFVRGTSGEGFNIRTVYPYLPCKTGGYDNCSRELKANLRNFKKIYWT